MELILIRGLPGSGKSTLAKAISKDYIHLETDMFWGDNYEFDATRLREAHEWCQSMTRQNLQFLKEHTDSPLKGIIVSNTFTTCWELGAYFEMAEDYGIVPQVILCQGSWQNVHDCPEDVIDRMRNRFEYDISSLYKFMVYPK